MTKSGKTNSGGIRECTHCPVVLIERDPNVIRKDLLTQYLAKFIDCRSEFQ